MNIDGTIHEMSPAWRAVVRRWYRQARRGGLGPMGAHERVEAQVKALKARTVRLGA